MLFPSSLTFHKKPKPQLRDDSAQLLMTLMETACPPQQVVEALAPALQHKNWRVKEKALALFEQALSR